MKIIGELKNVVDMAVGVIIGSAFGAIVTSLVNDMFMPLISLLTGKVDFANLFVALDGNEYATLAQAQEVGVSTINYGMFISQVINFLLVAVCIFFFVRFVNKIMAKLTPAKEEAPKAVRLCPFCQSELHDQATRCPHCTSDVSETVVTA